MKKLIILIGLSLSVSVFAAPQESALKAKLRSIITQFAGQTWSDKLLGKSEVVEESALSLPEIPSDLKKSTDVSSYTKISKDLTEYDQLPRDRKRQFDYKFLEELFLVTRKSEAKDEDLANWMNTLDQGGSREGIYQALVLDEVYNSLESIEEAPTAKLIDFSLHFSEKFLNQTFNKDSLQKLNLYSLKRIFTEKGLDLLAYYESKDLDALYRWYAYFSAELAKNYGSLLLSNVRKDTHVEYHYEWAKSMPIQHIKSEFIIKLHIVMNGLQLIN